MTESLQKDKQNGIFIRLSHYLNANKIGDLLLAKGLITHEQLYSALYEQSIHNKVLGNILIEQKIINTHQLNRILLKQKFLRATTALLLCTASMGAMVKKAKADYIDDIPARISVASSENAQKIQQVSLGSYPSLFGSSEKKSTNLGAFTKWIDMFNHFERDMTKPQSRKVIAALQDELRKYQSDSIKTMAEKVNDYMNRTKYIQDNTNWGKSDYWATPVEFLTRGGDCEDFAIAKYFALRAVGVPENRLRIAIVQDLQKNIPHAILIVYSEAGPLVLDNQIKTTTKAERISHYRPIFSINREAWWLHTGSDTTIIASAQ